MARCGARFCTYEEMVQHQNACAAHPPAVAGEGARPETGPMRFGDDWPGVFIRGDNAGACALTVRRLMDVARRVNADPFLLVEAESVLRLFSSAIMPCPDAQKAVLLRPTAPTPMVDKEKK